MRLDTTAPLPDGRRVRLRLPHTADRQDVARLHERLGLAADELELARALRFDPRTQIRLCATVWDEGHEVLVGWATASRDAAAPDTLLADETLAPGVRGLLEAAVADHRRVAA